MYHRGGVSFGDAQSEGWARSSAIIDARYPFFRPNNTRERATDPLACLVRRARARAARARRDAAARAAHPAQPPRRDRRHREVRGRAAGDARARVRLLGALSRWSRASCSAPSWIVDGRRVEHEFLLPGAATQVTRMNDEVARRSARGRARPVRLRRGAHPQPDRALARAVRRARRLSRSGRVLGARPVPRVPELLAALHEDRSVRHPRRPLGVRALPGRHRGVADAGLAADAATSRVDYLASSAPRSRSGSTPSTTGCSRARARPTTSCASTTPSPRGWRSSSTVRSSGSAGGPREPDEQPAARRAVARRVRGARLGEEGSRRGERAGRGRSAARAWRSTTSAR